MHNRDKTHCPKGHPYDEENTISYQTKEGWNNRYCRKCASKRSILSGHKRRAKHKLDAIALLGGRCQDCGEEFKGRPEVFDFDHQRDKTASLSALLCRSVRWSTITKELEKCDLVCSNCHRTRTKDRKQE